jgi:pyridoxamine 5'-phosphate oxidase-like protein
MTTAKTSSTPLDDHADPHDDVGLHDAALHDVVAGYRTCEFATMTRAGVPIAWPAVCLLAPDGRSITLTTSIALPRKALNIRRDPRIALLFSDPTGSGRDDLPQVLVQGTATCPEEIVTSPAGFEEYWLQLWDRQPGKVDASSALNRRLMDFYFFRLVITVTPNAVVTRPPIVRVPSSAAAVPGSPQPGRRDHDAWAETARRLGRYPNGVLGTAADGELPDLRRVRVTADPDERLLRLSSADGSTTQEPVPESMEGLRGSLLFHGHDEQLSALRQFGVLGTVVRDAGGFALRPERFVPGSTPESPLAMARTVLRLRRTAMDYLAERGLARPVVSWEEFLRLQRRSSTR